MDVRQPPYHPPGMPTARKHVHPFPARMAPEVALDKIEMDDETRDFVDYWFAPTQAEDLSRIARVLADRPRTDDPLRVALSRMIVTKEMGASLARDTSHSRPHRVADTNDYDVFAEFIK